MSRYPFPLAIAFTAGAAVVHNTLSSQPLDALVGDRAAYLVLVWVAIACWLCVLLDVLVWAGTGVVRMVRD